MWVFVVRLRQHQALQTQMAAFQSQQESLRLQTVREQDAVGREQREQLRFHRSQNDWERPFAEEAPFVTAVVKGVSDDLWVGTEDNGVYWYNAAAHNWKHFSEEDGLGNNRVYSIACDKLGRIWVGELNRGVAVFNGAAWKNYDVLEGPIGERVYRVAVCPTDGDVWLATSAGLTRYSAAKDRWRHHTQNNGLPSLQAAVLAFDPDGNLYIGTQCDGIVIGRAADDYRQWRVIPGPQHLADAYSGSGLPTGLINDLLIAHDGRIYVATPAGLAHSSDRGETWSYIRGRDYAAKVQQKLGGPPKDWKPADEDTMETLLPQDYVTCLAEDDSGLIWLGFREQGFGAWNPNTDQQIFGAAQEQGGLPDNYITAILPTHDAQVYVGSYGGGLVRSREPFEWNGPKTKRPRPGPLPNASHTDATSLAFPSPAKSPAVDELNALLQEVSLVQPGATTNSPVVALEDDWKTEGEWQGRYGRYWIVLCANWSPNNDVWGAGWDVQYDARIGPNHVGGDSMRYWIHWLATSENRSLEMSPTYLHSRVLKGYTTWDMNRRQSEWDDHGEAYSMSMDGPHLYCSLIVPAGLFYLSLYDFNKDGHDGANRYRDYRVSIRAHPGLSPVAPQSRARTFYTIDGFDQQPEWASGRIRDFWGGVYKRFLVRGPTNLTIEIKRNFSLNAILAGVMLDLVDELPPPYYQTRQEWEQKGAGIQQSERSPEPAAGFSATKTESEAAGRLFEELQQVASRNDVWWACNKRRCYAELLNWYLHRGQQEKAGASAGTMAERIATCYYELGLYAKWEETRKALGLTTTREIEKAIRWDGVTYSCAGKGYEIISRYAATNSIKSNK